MHELNECPRCRKKSLSVAEIDWTFTIFPKGAKPFRNILITSIPAASCRECGEVVFDGYSHHYIDTFIKDLDERSNRVSEVPDADGFYTLPPTHGEQRGS